MDYTRLERDFQKNDPSTRTSVSVYKNLESKLLKKKLIAKMAFNTYRTANESAAINSLRRLQQKGNDARNYDNRISKRKFKWALLNNTERLHPSFTL